MNRKRIGEDSRMVYVCYAMTEDDFTNAIRSQADSFANVSGLGCREVAAHYYQLSDRMLAL